MSKPVLVYYDILNYTPENFALLEEIFEVVKLKDPSHDSDEILARAEAALAPLGYYFGPEKMARCPRLKVIGSNTTGHPHIDVDHARAKGIKVVTLKDHQGFLDTITPTSEMTFGLIIALTRNMFPGFRSVLDGRWERWPFGGPRMLSRMTLGVIGLGRLGGKVAKYGEAFGMRVLFYDPHKKSDYPWEQVDNLEDLAAQSDIISLHVPHEPETERMLDSSFFASVKPGSYFINTARGELVDETALVEALESGRLAGAAVDVLDGEFAPGFENHVLEHPLVGYARTHDNVIITPHIGGSTHDAWSLTQEYTVRKVIEALEEDN